MKDEIIRISMREIYEPAEKYMGIMMGFHRDSPAAKKSKDATMTVRRIFDELEMEFLVSKVVSDAVHEDYFLIGETRIDCSRLARLEKGMVLGGYAFLFHAPMPDLSKQPVSVQYLADSWETAFVDAGRDLIRKRLVKKAEQEYGRKAYITDTIAPGMYGMAGSDVGKFFEFLDASRIHLKILESGIMMPVKSFAGIYLILDQDVVIKTMDCSECLSGGKGCEYCKNYAERFL